MGTQVLAGSKGVYVPAKPMSGSEFKLTVTHDTDMDSSSFPVKFEGAAVGCYISKEQIKFSDDAKYKECQNESQTDKETCIENDAEFPKTPLET